MKLKSSTKILALCLIALSLSSCIEFLEILGALSVLSADTPMPLVRAELGQPIWSGKDEQGFDTDRFRLRSYSHAPKKAQSLEVGSGINITVTYDERKRVRVVRAHDDEGREIPLERLAR